MSVYKTQSLLTINLATGMDLSGASVTRILYKKPNGTKGYWTATVSSQNLQYVVSNGDIDQEGTWQFQSYIEVGGKKGFGLVAKQVFEPNLQ
jgi:hypothetical protein